MENTKDKIIIRCKHCNNRMFDYVAGNMCLEIKCSRCKKPLGVIRFTEDYIRANAKNGEYKI